MMISIDEIVELAEGYKGDVSIGVLGSHSALEITHGAKQEGMNTVVVCQRGREKTYTKYYKALFDETLVMERFSDMVEEENQEKLRELNTIFIPSRSFSVYVGYDNIEGRFNVPMLGNRFMLRCEERSEPRNQYHLLRKAGIKMPRIFKTPEEIDRLVIVKVMEKGSVERAFFYASSHEEYEEKARERIEKGIVDADELRRAVIEEYILGAKFNANYFWSPLVNELDLLGFDRRIQTNLDGVLDLPAESQMEIRATVQNIEVGHSGATMRESQLEKIFEAGEKFAEVSREEYPPGMLGLFALQGALDKNLGFYVFDVSPRIPGCPCVEPTSPYMKYKYMKEVGPGRRVAMEIKEAIAQDRIGEIVT
ncbi:MAG: formate--phosphoribosylaminoimidazolecarboxamide ligase family protein [Candidatus Hydrothermarchaeaceae archaeon]